MRWSSKRSVMMAVYVQCNVSLHFRSTASTRSREEPE